ncbi:uncharacterized protein F5Z01DRAFT_71234 [Emericellopsis atlantica]|uniref:HIT-type domain-containing protein n=1 Tax=Emericellopsis atlantica TaxID=2614577 RepID=A0A9P7ZMV8_9HYPO|nr:uncharacterized protein F5Z01DRAFT_71234 [Emericellopsis atlantica]KAG9255049.1 hypothetical protein F5Z01DRAFT_71234 [Emericellopsis atlantica]
MNNFGVFEVASAKTTNAPGWAYVPDTGHRPTSTLAPTNRKRARNTAPGPSLGDLTARQEARLRKEVDALMNDGNRDNTIPLPGKRSQGKTGATRKILQSQKTFANHLDDFHAMQQAEATAAATAASSKRGSTLKNQTDMDTSMTDALAVTKPHSPILKPLLTHFPPPHPGDDDPLLMSRVPSVPSDEEIRALLSHPPLTYLEARGTWDGNDAAKPPIRVFCEVCGYWGRVRCMKCGTRVCALDCLETHREECVTRYGL